MKTVTRYPELNKDEYTVLVDIIGESEPFLRDFIAAQLRNANCGNKDVEEILGKVYDTAYMRFDKLSTGENPIGWLILVARNKLLTYFRNSKRVEPLETMKFVYCSGNEIDLGLDEIFPKKLKQADRDLLKRKYVHEDTVEEIASDLHINENTIKKRLMVARGKVRKIFKKI